jgi:RNA polymerase sigma-70 factor (ECF subfamily)
MKTESFWINSGSAKAPSRAPESFETTQWSAIFRVSDPAESISSRALEDLCRKYWYPLYSFARRRGKTAHEAQDVTQDFIKSLLEDKSLWTVHPSKGKFRTFLLTAFSHYLTNHNAAARAQKRGGDRETFSLDEAIEAGRLEEAGVVSAAPDAVFDREWAAAVTNSVFEQLRREYDGDTKRGRFDRLRVFLTTDDADADYTSIARSLGLSEAGVRSAVHRLRRRYAEVFRATIGETVGSRDDVEEEIRYLLSVLHD